MAHPTVTTTATRTRRLVWAAIRATPGGHSPSNAHSVSGPYYRVKVIGGRIYAWRADTAVPVLGYPVTMSAVSAPGAGESDDYPRLAVDFRGWARAVWQRTGGSSPGVYSAYSSDAGRTWSTESLAIPSATRPTNAVSGMSGTVVDAGLVGTALKITVQHAGDALPSSPVTATDETGAALALADDSFGLSFGFDRTAPLLLHCVIDSETDSSDWVSTNYSAFKRLV